MVLELLDNNKFSGPVHLVGRSAADIGGRKVLANIDELPQDIDLAVLTLPAAAVREAIEGCVRRKVRTAVIFASGFAEVDSDGVSEQDRIGAIARAGGLALVGPNCLGFMNYVDGVCRGLFLAARPYPACRKAPEVPLPSSRRAAVSATICRADWPRGAFQSHAGFRPETRRASVLRDFIRYLLDDPVTQVIALYAEDIRRPQEFIDVAGEALRRGKPIVMMHPGRGAKARKRRRVRIRARLPAITRSCVRSSNMPVSSLSIHSTN